MTLIPSRPHHMFDSQEPTTGMEVHMTHVAFGITVHELKAELANILHTNPFLPSNGTPFNFDVHLIPQRRPGSWRSASLTLPTIELAQQFLQLFAAPSNGRELYMRNMRIIFQKSRKAARRETLERILRMPYEDPSVAQAREHEAAELQGQSVRISTIQFGWECRDSVFSAEYEKVASAYLVYDGDRREFRVKVPSVGLIDDTRLFAIRVSQIFWVSASVQQPSGCPFIFFSLSYPPSFETEMAIAPFFTGLSLFNSLDSRPRQRQRWSYFDTDHGPIAPYTSLAIRLECNSQADINTFRTFARRAHTHVATFSIPVERRGVFSKEWREQYYTWTVGLPWLVAFRVEALLRSWLVDMSEIMALRQPIERILRTHGREYTVELLREFAARLKALFWYGEDQSSRSGDESDSTDFRYTATSTVTELFALIASRFVYKPLVTPAMSDDPTAPFNCLHLTVTPTTMVLDGPYPERSNRVMRTYYRNQDCFLRVSFQDENRLQYRFDRDVDGRDFINRRVKGILLDGIDIAGAHFEFLAYSQSALKEHAVWFVKRFRYLDPSGNSHLVDASTIIDSLGNFHDLEFDPMLIHCPARYAARISQAFTATEASISAEVGQIMTLPDVKDTSGTYCFTDGVGTMSPLLAKEIWKALRERGRRRHKGRTYPRAYQIRFQGSKGMLSVDYTLPGRAIVLRPSMVKFEAPQSMTIEIARAFDKPGMYYLNRPLIMLLEGLGVPYEVFQQLQDAAVRDAQESVESLASSARLLEIHGLGVSYRLTSTMLALHKLGVGSLYKDEFWQQMMDFAVNHVLRELKHHARIPVHGQDSWTLVGVADVHRELQEGEVFACIDSQHESGLIYLEGPVLVSRSPTIHPGDVQVVHAIGQPPPGSPFARESLRNTIVFSILGASLFDIVLGLG